MGYIPFNRVTNSFISLDSRYYRRKKWKNKIQTQLNWKPKYDSINKGLNIYKTYDTNESNMLSTDKCPTKVPNIIRISLLTITHTTKIIKKSDIVPKESCSLQEFNKYKNFQKNYLRPYIRLINTAFLFLKKERCTLIQNDKNMGVSIVPTGEISKITKENFTKIYAEMNEQEVKERLGEIYNKLIELKEKSLLKTQVMEVEKILKEITTEQLPITRPIRKIHKGPEKYRNVVANTRYFTNKIGKLVKEIVEETLKEGNIIIKSREEIITRIRLLRIREDLEITSADFEDFYHQITYEEILKEITIDETRIIKIHKEFLIRAIRLLERSAMICDPTNKQIIIQTKGLTMGNSDAKTLCDYYCHRKLERFMSRQVMNERGIILYIRYVDDILIIHDQRYNPKEIIDKYKLPYKMETSKENHRYVGLLLSLKTNSIYYEEIRWNQLCLVHLFLKPSLMKYSVIEGELYRIVKFNSDKNKIYERTDELLRRIRSSIWTKEEKEYIINRVRKKRGMSYNHDMIREFEDYLGIIYNYSKRNVSNHYRYFGIRKDVPISYIRYYQEHPVIKKR